MADGVGRFSFTFGEATTITVVLKPDRNRTIVELTQSHMQDTANDAYSGWPDRLYLIGVDGDVVYAGGRGPWGFQPDDLEAAIEEELGR